jgi:Fe-S cluster assembly iron-binding protein IscA
MIICGFSQRDRTEVAGRFYCPRCGHDRDFELIRTWTYFHLYFLPIVKTGLVAERILCGGCHTTFSIALLAGNAGKLPSAFEAGMDVADSLSDQLGNVVDFTDAAVEEVWRRHREGRFGDDVVVRVDSDPSESRRVPVSFDFPLANGCDWIGHSNGISVVVDRRVASDLKGRTIDFRDGDFVLA